MGGLAWVRRLECGSGVVREGGDSWWCLCRRRARLVLHRHGAEVREEGEGGAV